MYAAQRACGVVAVLLLAYACGPGGARASSTSEPAASSSAPPFSRSTHVYKTVGDERLHADVYVSGEATARPVLVWLHGGALMFGSREDVPARLLDLCRFAGCNVVSFDYRLAPAVELPAIIEDLRDAFAWLANGGRAVIAPDLDKIVVAGASAGGYLALASGYLAEPEPAALVSYWGYGALDTFDAEPSEFYRTVAPLVSEQEAWSEGGNLYLYLRQQGLWTKVVTGFDPATQVDALSRYAPVHNVRRGYPPVMLVHGTNDTDVPHSESVDMAAALSEADIAHELVLVDGAPHGLIGGPQQEVSAALGRAMVFAYRHMFGTEPDPRTARLIAAHETIDRGFELANNDRLLEAKAAMESALDAGPTFGAAWAMLCRRAGSEGFGSEFLEVCDRAIDSATTPPQRARAHDRRAVVRAMAGDLRGSIEDLEAYLAAGIGDEDARAQRRAWIGALARGVNPFASGDGGQHRE